VILLRCGREGLLIPLGGRDVVSFVERELARPVVKLDEEAFGLRVEFLRELARTVKDRFARLNVRVWWSVVRDRELPQVVQLLAV
jgi:hypothetical protein